MSREHTDGAVPDAGDGHPSYGPTPLTRARRKDRMTYDAAAVHAVLDEALICHVGFLDDAGRARVMPTNFWRVGGAVYLHGGHKSHLMRAIAAGAELSVAVTLVDAKVLARSAFAHSMNYRSVILYGRGRLLTDRAEKAAVVPPFVDKMVPGRGAVARPVNDKELDATAIARIPLDQVGLKSRSGPVGDAAADLDWPVWAGVVPLRLTAGEPEPDAALAPGVVAGHP